MACSRLPAMGAAATAAAVAAALRLGDTALAFALASRADAHPLPLSTLLRGCIAAGQRGPQPQLNAMQLLLSAGHAPSAVATRDMIRLRTTTNPPPGSARAHVSRPTNAFTPHPHTSWITARPRSARIRHLPGGFVGSHAAWSGRCTQVLKLWRLWGGRADSSVLSALRRAEASPLTLFRTLAVLGSPPVCMGSDAEWRPPTARMVEGAVRTGASIPHALTWRDRAAAIQECVVALGRGAAASAASSSPAMSVRSDTPPAQRLRQGDRLLATAVSVRPPRGTSKEGQKAPTACSALPCMMDQSA